MARPSFCSDLWLNSWPGASAGALPSCASHVTVLVLQMGRPGTRLLIIDDNQGLLDLLHRYLTGQPCLMMGTRSGTRACVWPKRQRPTPSSWTS